jgi:hypothetical protein
VRESQRGCGQGSIMQVAASPRSCEVEWIRERQRKRIRIGTISGSMILCREVELEENTTHINEVRCASL